MRAQSGVQADREACKLSSNAQAHWEACELYAAQAHWERGACLGPMQEMGMNFKHQGTVDCRQNIEIPGF